MNIQNNACSKAFISATALSSRGANSNTDIPLPAALAMLLRRRIGVSRYCSSGVVRQRCAIVIYTRREVPSTFIPFLYRYDRLYRDGLIDGHEWKQHRFDFIWPRKPTKPPETG